MRSSGSNSLGIGIVGSGYMGGTYAECLSKYNKRCRLVAISGGTRAPQLASRYGVEHEASYDALLGRRDVDAVVVATPPAFHLEQVIGAASMGKHALVEKPMAVDVEECNRMIEARKKSGVYLEVLQTQRFRGVFTRAKNLIDEGRIGRVRMMRGVSLFTEYEGGQSWLVDPKHGGAMLDLGVHSFDMMRHLSGSEVTRVFSMVKTFGDFPLPDYTSMTQLSFSNGEIGQQWMSFEATKPSLPKSMFGFVIVGERGTLDLDGYGKIQLGTEDGWETIWEMPPIDYINNPLDPIRLQSFTAALQAFVDDVLDGRKPTVPAGAGRAAVEVVEAAKMSSRTGKAVDLPL